MDVQFNRNFTFYHLEFCTKNYTSLIKAYSIEIKNENSGST